MRRNPLAVLRTVSVTVCLKFVDERLFCGYDNGTMAVFSRITCKLLNHFGMYKGRGLSDPRRQDVYKTFSNPPILLFSMRLEHTMFIIFLNRIKETLNTKQYEI